MGCAKGFDKTEPQQLVPRVTFLFSSLGRSDIQGVCRKPLEIGPNKLCIRGHYYNATDTQSRHESLPIVISSQSYQECLPQLSEWLAHKLNYESRSRCD